MVAGVIEHYWLVPERLCANHAANCYNSRWLVGGGGHLPLYGTAEVHVVHI